jgi:hypothetical protein
LFNNTNVAYQPRMLLLGIRYLNRAWPPIEFWRMEPASSEGLKTTDA